MTGSRTALPTPGRSLIFGHGLQLRCRPLEFLASLRALADVVEVRPGTRPAYFVGDIKLVEQILVGDAASFDKGALAPGYQVRPVAATTVHPSRLPMVPEPRSS